MRNRLFQDVWIVLAVALAFACMNFTRQDAGRKNEAIVTGADQVSSYLPFLRNKKVGMVVNQTSIVGRKLSVDSLGSLGVQIKYIFGPEHGFRANASNGAHVTDEVDERTGIPIISLYGSRRKPSPAQMKDIDVLIYDIQDVGCRFYTNINTLRDVMEACAENNKELLILDRPNPNGFVDGPVLDMKFQSGIGRFPIPIAHGMTIGEFAGMINGEGWIAGKKKCKTRVIKMKNYRHSLRYQLPVPPSPNLNTQQSVLLYPSLCLFEGTILSQGRGTEMPFTVLGAPQLKGRFPFSFTPRSLAGKSETPLHMNQLCYGIDLRDYNADALRNTGKINLRWMIDMYQAFPDKALFFDRSQSKQMGSIDALAGTDRFKRQIMAGATEADIRKSWEPQLTAYKKSRLQYLLYP
jgi:uncharacterized protein YbbC (DUF1343 family)